MILRTSFLGRSLWFWNCVSFYAALLSHIPRSPCSDIISLSVYVQMVSECYIGESCVWRRDRCLERDKLDRCTRKSVRCLHFRLSYHQGEFYFDVSAQQSLTLDYAPRVQSPDANATTVTNGQCYLGMGYICFCSREHLGNPAVANS